MGARDLVPEGLAPRVGHLGRLRLDQSPRGAPHKESIFLQTGPN